MPEESATTASDQDSANTANPPPGDAPGDQSATEAPQYTKSQMEAIVRDRLESQKRAVEAQTKRVKDEAEAARLKEQSEWQKLAEQHEARVKELESEIGRRDQLDLRRRVAAKHSLPTALAERLAGDTEEALDADAKELAKLVKTEEERAPQRGNSPNPRPAAAGSNTVEAREAELRKSGRYRGL